MKKINRYILKEITPSVLVGVLILTLIVITQQLIRISDYIIAGGVPPLEIGKLMLYSLPAFFEISIPVSLILGVTITFSRLSIDSEIVALRSSGISINQLLPPVIIISMAGFISVSYLTLYGSSIAYNNFYTTLRKISYYGSKEVIKERVFTKLTDSTLIYIDHMSPDGSKMNGVLISEKKNYDEPVIITAEDGEKIPSQEFNEGGLILNDGIMDQKIKDEYTHRVVTFEKLQFNVGDSGTKGNVSINKPKEISVPEILEIIRQGGITQVRFADLLYSLHRRLSLPFACIVFAFFAVPIGVMQKSRGKSLSFIFTGIIVFMYYLFLGVAKSMKNYSLPLSIGIIWLPNLLFGLVTVLILLKIEKDSAFLARLGRITRRKN